MEREKGVFFLQSLTLNEKILTYTRPLTGEKKEMGGERKRSVFFLSQRFEPATLHILYNRKLSTLTRPKLEKM